MYINLLREGIEAIDKGHWEEAIKLLEAAIRLYPDNAEAWLWLSTCTPTLGRREYCLRRVLDLEPNNYQAQRMLKALTGPSIFSDMSVLDDLRVSKPKIFISYRRDDSSDTCGRIYDDLADYFGEECLFRDVNSIPLGVDFDRRIRQIIEQCAVVLAVIGPRWLSITNEAGRRRLEDTSDFVRVELELAFANSIPVIPVLVQGALFPDPKFLPRTLDQLVRQNGISIGRDPHYHGDMKRLVKGLAPFLSHGVNR